MDYTRNIDKYTDSPVGVSYGQAIDVDNTDNVAQELFTLAEFKLYAKIDQDIDDTLIPLLISAARRICENYTNINFIDRQVIAVINNSNGGAYLPYGPLGDIESMEDELGVVVTDYRLGGTKFRQVLSPCSDYLKVTYQGGYPFGECPAELINAVKAQCLFLYENRGDVNAGISPVVTMILSGLRRVE